ncbi:MAG TPA: glycoside hydrolase family 172 protein [Puia sp.]|nr:glycoside hydrolase family 172 protein [Puia sp.]
MLIWAVIASLSGDAQDIKQKENPKSSISLRDELRELSDISRLPFYREGIVEQVSSYDTTGGNDDGFNGKYSYIRRNADSSLVIFDEAGPGVINRIATPTPTSDTLDFYIDDTLHPMLSIAYRDLFSGKVFPFVAPLCGQRLGGYYCYFPILFQKHCRIVSRGKKMQFHQIQYRRYPEGTTVKSFTGEPDAEEKKILNKVLARWTVSPGNSGSPGSRVQETEVRINPGETKTLFNLRHGGRITGILLDVDDQEAWAARDIDIRINWDDEKIPAVYCPAADFFGYAFGLPSMQSLLLGSNGKKNYCYFTMPFGRSAVIQLIYRNRPGARPVQVRASINYVEQQRDATTEGKFYVRWNSEKRTEKTGPYVLLQAKGRGHYVGAALMEQGLRPGMTYFFEADDSTAVDGVPRIHGTGSEDYFNGGWYALPDGWNHKESLPLHGALDYSLLYCRTGGYRFYLSDKLSFSKSLFESFETEPVPHALPVIYTSLAFYYCSRPPAEYLPPTDELTASYMPDTLMIYPQLMDYTTSGKISSRSFWEYDTGGESFVFTVSDSSSLSIAPSKPPPGKYRLFADLVKWPEGCRFSVWQRGKPVSPWISTDGLVKERANWLYLGDLVMNEPEGFFTLKFLKSGAANSFFLNRFILVRK